MWSVDKKRFAGAIILIVILLVPTVFVSGAQGYIPVLFFLVLYTVSFALLLFERSRVQFNDVLPKDVCVRNSAFEHVITVKNRTFFIIPSVQLELYDTSGAIGTGLLKETVSLGAKEEKTITVPVMPAHIGTFRCGISNMMIRGMLGILSWKINVEKPNLLTVLPQLHDIENFIEFAGAGEHTSSEMRGQKGNSEPAGVREYTVGDTMKDIHWKLSASGRGLMTKLREETNAGDMDVILYLDDFSFESARDVLIETAMSLINYGESHGMRGRLIYRDDNGRIRDRIDVPLDLFSDMVNDRKISGSKYNSDMLHFALETGCRRTPDGLGADTAPGASLVMITGNPSEGLIIDLSRITLERRVVLISLEGDEEMTAGYGIDHFVIHRPADLERKVKRAFYE